MTIDRTNGSTSRAWRTLLEHLASVREENGRKSYRVIGSAMNLAHSRVANILTGARPLVDEGQLLKLVRALGGSREDAEKAVRLYQAARSAGDEGRRAAWFMAGPDARTHFGRRALGQQSLIRGGDLFRGRVAALRTVREWVTDPISRGQPLVITGQPGAGKSSVLARIVVDLEASGGLSGVAVHARTLTCGGLVAALAAGLFVGPPTESPDVLLAALAGMSRNRTTVIAVDAMDEMASTVDSQDAARLLAEIAILPWTRVVVATRALTSGDRFGIGTVLRLLAVQASGSANLIDLDADRFFDLAGIRAFARAVLTQHDARYPGPPGAAWQRYRDDSAVTERLADAIAARAGRNYLVVALAATQLSTGESPVDPGLAGFDPAVIPHGIREAIARSLDTLPGDRRVRTLGLFSALAYARGPGLDDANWLRFAAALGYPAAVTDLDELRVSRVADFLLQVTADDGGQRVTRLFHQALVDELIVARGDRVADEHRIVQALRIEFAEHDWARAGRYLLRHLLDHAAVAGAVDDLVTDLEFLVRADPGAVLSHLHRCAGERARLIGAIYRTSANFHRRRGPDVRRQLLTVDALRWRARESAERLLAGRNADHHEVLRPVWATDALASGALHQVFPATRGEIALYDIGGGPMLAFAGENQRLQVWNLLTVELVHEFGPTPRRMSGVTHCVVDGTTYLVGATADGRVDVRNAATGILVNAMESEGDTVECLAVARVSGRWLVAGAIDGGSVRLWELLSGEPIRHLDGEGECASDLAFGEIDGRPILIHGGRSGRVYVRYLDDADGDFVLQYPDSIFAVAFAHRAGTPVVFVGGYESSVAIWDLRSQLLMHNIDVPGSATAFSVGKLADDDVLLIGSGDGEVEMWGVASLRRIAILVGHHSEVCSVGLGLVDGRPMAFSMGIDEAVRVWELGNVGPAVRARQGYVGAVEIGTIRGRPAVLVGDDSRQVRLLDLADGRLIRQVGEGSTYIRRVVLFESSERNLALSADAATLTRVWDLADGTLVGEFAGDSNVDHLRDVRFLDIDGSLCMATVADRRLVIRTVDGWLDRLVADLSADGSDGLLDAAAISTNPELPVVAIVRRSGRLEIRDIANGECLQLIDTGIDLPHSMVLSSSRGLPAVVLVQSTISVWSVADGRCLAREGLGHIAFASVCVLGDRHLLVLALFDEGVVRVFDLDSYRWVGSPIHLPNNVNAVSASSAGVVVGFDRELACFAWDMDAIVRQ